MANRSTTRSETLRASDAEVTSVPMRRNVMQLPFKPVKRSVVPDAFSAPSRDPLTVAGLFAGIGGIELGLSRSNHEARLLCEIDPAANAVLDAHFGTSISRVLDVRTVKPGRQQIDLLTAGFPCQDLSQAGNTAGIAGERSGLVGEVFRILRSRRIEWVLLENVAFMLKLGRGGALDVILTELERLGYRWAYRLVNSRAFGVPQRRERVYFLASRTNDPRNVLFVDEVTEPEDTRSFRQVPCGFYWTEGVRGLGWAIDSIPTLKGGSTVGIPSPPAIIFPDGRIARPDVRDAERIQGFDEDWTRPAEAVSRKGARWKLIGNAVTVNAAAWIGERLRNPGIYDATGDARLSAGSSWPSAAYNVDGERYVADLSAWPVRVQPNSLTTFLRHETPDLSERATAGFLSRARSSTLRFPSGFLESVAAHLARMRGESLRAII